MKSKKIILITGGSRGIGQGIVQRFISENTKVYLTYRKQNKFIKELQKKKSNRNEITLIKCDFLNDSFIKKINQVIKKEKKIDLLINNVGDASKRSKFIISEDSLWEKSIKLNLLNPIKLTKKLLPQLNKSKKSVIINISSIASRTGGGGDSLHYAVSKAGINIFTKGLAKEMKKTVRVVGIAPSAIKTEFQKKYSSSRRINKMIKETPLKRIGLIKEVVDLVIFLSSENASYISGETFFITGGR